MTFPTPRISLRSPPAPFVAVPGRTARVSFLEVEDGEPVIRGALDDSAIAVVLVWPTDDRGYVDVAAVQRGDVRATTWRLTAAEVAALRALAAAGWTLGDRDLLVTGGPHPSVVPCRETFRASTLAPRVTDADLRRLAGG